MSSGEVKRPSRDSERRKSAAEVCPLRELHSEQQETTLR